MKIMDNKLAVPKWMVIVWPNNTPDTPQRHSANLPNWPKVWNIVEKRLRQASLVHDFGKHFLLLTIFETHFFSKMMSNF